MDKTSGSGNGENTDLIEAVAFARGNGVMLAYPEAAESKHAVALLNLQARVEEGNKS